MREVIDTLDTMVGDADYVVTHAWETCTGQAVTERVGPLIRDRDKAVNRGERKIRRLVVEHLSLNPGQDVSGCLAMLLIAKDVERIGDHGRNLFDVADRLSGRVPEFHFFSEMNGLYGELAQMLTLLRRAVSESNAETARAILDRYVQIKPRMKAFIPGLYDAGLPCDEAVATTLLARSLRRIIAHTGNAASGIVFPVETIDFISHGLADEAKDR